MIVILGPTATGKTKLAAMVAAKIGGEVISADSRQVYRGMDIGTGKDYDDYMVEGINIPYHLIDLADPGEEYNVYRYQEDFLKVYNDIIFRAKVPVLCGGTGMYIDAVLRGYKLVKVPSNKILRDAIKDLSHDDLKKELASYGPLHNVTDTEDRDRTVRAIEIAAYHADHPELEKETPVIRSFIFGIDMPREVVRSYITKRLKERLQHGMIDEVRELINKGISPDKLKFYGLEYRYLTEYILGEINYDDMVQRLNTAIHQFAKRQMTWFRRMERQGVRIHWVDGTMELKQKLQFILKTCNL